MLAVALFLSDPTFTSHNVTAVLDSSGELDGAG